MKIPIFYVNAFAEKNFEGNPAAICPLNQWLPDQMMQNIAMQNNLSETAFFIARETQPILRWFSPTVEVDFCGHATLAAGHVALAKSGRGEIAFETKRGMLSVKKIGSDVFDIYQMDFPQELSQACAVPAELSAAMGAAPVRAYRGANMMLVYETQAQIADLNPDMARLKKLCAVDNVGIIATAPAAAPDFDFVSRFFAPAHGIDEDAVTGSAHCQSAPYWAERLGKTKLKAQQISQRGGKLSCEVQDDRVLLQGACVDYLQGEINLGEVET